MKILKGAILIIARDWDRVRIIIPLLSLLIFFLWFSHWGMGMKQEIDERADLGGRYAGLEAITTLDR